MMTKENKLQSVERAFSVIELLDVYGELGVTEIGKRLSLDKSTAFRVLATLRSLGYIVQNPSSSKYCNSYKLFEIGTSVARRTGLPKLAHPYMLELSQLTGEAVNLAIRDGTQALYLSKIESTDTIKVCMNLGQTIPLYCTGLGKALIAYCSEEEVREIFREQHFFRYTARTFTDIPSLLVDLEKIRSCGYSIDNEEHIKGIHCIAAPVFDSSKNVLAAISIALPQFRFEEMDDEERLNYLVRDVARRFSASLGSREP